MTLKVNHSPSWEHIPAIIARYLAPFPSSLYEKSHSYIAHLFAVTIPQPVTYQSTTIAFCNRVATIINGYDNGNKDRFKLISKNCRIIWDKVIKAEDRVLDLLNQRLIQFNYIRKIEKLLYRSLIDIASSPFKCRFLDALTDHLKTKQVTLHIIRGQSSAFISIPPHPWIQLQVPKTYNCYQNVRGQRFWQTASMEELFIHESLHHMNEHIAPGFSPSPLGTIWTDWAEREVICGDKADGSTSEFSEKAFAENERTALRQGHYGIVHGLSPKDRFLRSIRYGVTSDIERFLATSNARAIAIHKKISELTDGQVHDLFQERTKVGRRQSYTKFFLPYSHWFDVNSIPQEMYVREFDACNHWPRSARVEQASIEVIKLNQFQIRRLLKAAQEMANFVDPLEFWADLETMQVDGQPN